MPKILGINKVITGDLVQDGTLTEADLSFTVKSLISEEYITDTLWTAPLGVTQVEVVAKSMKYVASNLGAALVDGNAYTWGTGTSGQLGDGTIVSKSSPVLVVGGLKFKQIVSGSADIGITTEGFAYTWGFNGNGELGDGTFVNKSSPVAVLGGLKFKQISYTSGITSDGTAYAWGANNTGKLGDGTTVSKSSPVAVIGGLKFKQINTSGSTCIGITSDGTAYAWGDNFIGQLGDGTTVSKSSPVLVVGGLKFKQVRISINNSLGITSDGTAYAWGSNSQGQLGDGTIVSKSSPVLVVGGLKFNQIDTCGITSDGTAYAWGSNNQGQLGDGTTINKSSPTLVLGGLKFLSYTPSTTVPLIFPVVPGQTYSIKVSDYMAKFDNNNLGIFSGCESITLKYYDAVVVKVTQTLGSPSFFNTSSLSDYYNYIRLTFSEPVKLSSRFHSKIIVNNAPFTASDIYGFYRNVSNAATSVFEGSITPGFVPDLRIEQNTPVSFNNYYTDFTIVMGGGTAGTLFNFNLLQGFATNSEGHPTAATLAQNFLAVHSSAF